MPKDGLTYKDAGVDVEKANSLIHMIKLHTESTYNKNVLYSLGHFAGFYALKNIARYKNPVLVASTDGVGTKLLIARQLKQYHSLGIDLVAMNVNDIITTGARPLFFLDYYATGTLRDDITEELIRGMAGACQEAGCALLGGETAEMPDLYQNDHFDLSGSCVGIVEKRNIIDGARISAGDIILGLTSSGVHSNGFSLIRKLFPRPELNSALGDTLLTPTRIYVQPLLKLFSKRKPKGIAHITGGGIYDNVIRILPAAIKAIIKKKSWPIPAVFKHIQKQGNIASKEMFKVFNMGIGMILIVNPKDVSYIKKLFGQEEFEVFELGWVEKDKKKGVRLI
jgi:phosphoribosylformylglycinamidine cyclo-ligase